MRAMVLDGSMSQLSAKRFMLGVASRSFASRLDIVTGLAALTSLFPDEVDKVTTSGRRVREAASGL